jgi:hypothetical protein
MGRTALTATLGSGTALESVYVGRFRLPPDAPLAEGDSRMDTSTNF